MLVEDTVQIDWTLDLTSPHFIILLIFDLLLFVVTVNFELTPQIIVTIMLMMMTIRHIFRFVYYVRCHGNNLFCWVCCIIHCAQIAPYFTD